VLEYLSREEIVKEFSERTLFLPAHKGVIDKGGLKWVSEDKNVAPAMDAFVKAAGQTLPATPTRCRRGSGPTPTTAHW
jgi:alpha-1,4-digalacturonate transport system substrate-binding protein